MDTDKLYTILDKETEALDRSHRAASIIKVANRYYTEAPEENNKFLTFCERLIASNKMTLFSIATFWFKKRRKVLDMQYFPTIEGWLYKYIHHWGACDQFCYRILNPFVDKYPELFPNVLTWIKSENIYVRRAGPVSLIRCGIGIRVKYDLDKYPELFPNVLTWIKSENIYVRRAGPVSLIYMPNSFLSVYLYQY